MIFTIIITFDQSEILSGQTFTDIQNLHYDLDLEEQPFHKTLQLMNMHCQTKLVAKKSEHAIEIVMISLYEPKLSYCDLDCEDSNPFCAHESPAYNGASRYWVWLQKVQRFIR